MKTSPLLLALLLGTSAWANDPVPDRVTMTLSEFLQMYEATKNRPDKPETAPRSFALSHARYAGRVVIEDDEPTSAVFTAKFAVEVLKKKGWARIPILDQGVAVQRARVNGVDAPLVLENGAYTLVTDRSGRFDIDVEFAVSVRTDGGSSGFEFPLQPSGATEMSLSVPAKQDLDFTVANARLKQDRVQGGNRIVDATLPATGSLRVSWQREIEEAKKEDARLYSEVHTLVGIGDGLMRATATVNQTILFAGVDELKVAIPSDVTVLDVKGAGLRDWTLGDDNVLTASLNYEAEGSYVLTIDLEAVVAGQDVPTPIVRPLGVERSKGWVGVQALGALEITSTGVTGATPVDVRTLPANILGVTGTPVLLGYKYLSDDPAIPLRVTEHEEVDVLVTLVDQIEGTTMFTEDGRRLTSVVYQVRNNRRQFLRLDMPEGATLWSASVAGRAVQPASSDDQLLVPLVRSQASGGALAAFAVRVVYVEDGAGPNEFGRGTYSGSLPKVDVPATYVAWTVFAPYDAKVKKNSYEGTLRHVSGLSRPIRATTVMQLDNQNAPMEQSAAGQAAGGGLGQGTAPVQVDLPLAGQQLYFEKLLVLEEELTASFDYKGLKD